MTHQPMIRRRRPARPLRAALCSLFAAAAVGACTDQDRSPTRPGDAAPRPAARSALVDERGNSRLVVDIELGPDARAERALVSVEAGDLERPLEFELGQRGDGLLYGTIAVPAGAERRITVRAFDGAGRETHAGSGALAVGRELTPQHALTLDPREPNAGGAIPAFVGSYRIAMEPRQAPWEEGRERAELAGRVLDPDGVPVPLRPDEIEWLPPDDLPGDFRWELDRDVARGFFWPAEAPKKVGRFELCYLARQYCRGTVLIPEKLFPTFSADDYVQVDGGSAQTCVLKRGGTTRCFGLGAYATAADLAPFTFTAISAGGDGIAEAASCGLESGGAVRCWGGNKYGQLGVGAASPASSASPLAVSSAEQFAAVTVGGRHACALNRSGKAFCWGDNGWGQLGAGKGSAAQSNAPVAVAGGLTFIDISAGYEHTCGITDTNDAYCWGYGRDLRLGSTDTAEFCGNYLNPCAHAPRPVTGAPKFTSISAGTTMTCALTALNDGYCWGHYAIGAAGVPASLAPTLVDGSHAFASVAAGGNHACGITLQQAVWCWGRNQNGQLGNGSTSDSDVPVQVVATSPYVSLGTGAAPCAVVQYGKLVECWGWNGYEQFGSPAPTTSSLPVALPNW